MTMCEFMHECVLHMLPCVFVCDDGYMCEHVCVHTVVCVFMHEHVCRCDGV